MSSLPYVPLDRRGWHLAMGLRPLDESKWFEVDARRDSELVLKKKLVNEERDVVVAIRETGAAPSAELLGLVVENLATYHPGVLLTSLRESIQSFKRASSSKRTSAFSCTMRSGAWKRRACVFPRDGTF